MAVTASSQITLVSIKDAKISSDMPTNPTVGELWLDTTGDNSLMKQWNGTAWVVVGDMSPQLSASLSKISATLENMTNDNKIDLKERQSIKDRLTDMIGAVLDDAAATLPTTAAIEASKRGSFYATRQSAFAAGMLINHSKYTALADKYNDLKTYLEATTPIKVWDTGLPNRNQVADVDKQIFRDKFLTYYIAEEDLKMATTAQLKKNADNIQVGGRNLIRNSTFNRVDDLGNLLDWVEINPLWQVVEAEDDRPTISIINAVATGNVTDVIYAAKSNKFPARIGDVFTFSAEIKVASAAAWDIKTPFIAEFFDALGNRVEFKEVAAAEIVDNTWLRISCTMTVTDAAVTQGGIKLALYRNGNLSVRAVQVERGNRMTDYMVAPEDSFDQVYTLESRMANAEQSITDEAIVNTVTQSTSYQEQLNSKANADDLGNYVNNDNFNQTIDAVKKDTDSKIASIDFAPYAKTSDLEQTAEAINAKFSAGGGINLIRNSVGYANTDNWQVTGAIKCIRGGELKQLGFEAGFTSEFGYPAVLEQTFFTMKDQHYTLSFYLKKDKDAAANADAGIAVLQKDGSAIGFVGKQSGLGITNGFEKYVFTFQATSDQMEIKLVFNHEAQAVITGVMLNIGYEPLQWSMATGELYNTNIQMDINGIKVIQTQDGIEVGRTVMTPEKFAGYFDQDGDGLIDEGIGSADEVFRMDKDEFVMKKAVIKEDLALGTVKIIDVKSPLTTGWAFVSNEE